jgi:hypothetical protein
MLGILNIHWDRAVRPRCRRHVASRRCVPACQRFEAEQVDAGRFGSGPPATEHGRHREHCRVRRSLVGPAEATNLLSQDRQPG